LAIVVEKAVILTSVSTQALQLVFHWNRVEMPLKFDLALCSGFVGTHF
jgi:hypothetical protein